MRSRQTGRLAARALQVAGVALFGLLAGCVGAPPPAGLAAACPTGVTATQTSEGVTLSWLAVENATGYDVARGDGDGPFVHNYGAAGAAANPTFLDANVTTGSSHRYIVSSRNASLPPEACSVVAVAPLAVPFFPTVASAVAAMALTAAACLILPARRK